MSAICGVCWAEYATSEDDTNIPWGCDCPVDVDDEEA